MAPFRELVAPGGLELRPAQRIRILGREHMRDGAVSPFELAQRRRPGRALARLVDLEQAGRALDHDVARGSEGLADERDAAHRLMGQPAEAGGEAHHPFGAGPRLAGAAPAEDEPGRPVVARALGRQLMIVQRTDAPPHEFEHVARQLKQFLPRRLALRNTPQVGA